MAQITIHHPGVKKSNIPIGNSLNIILENKISDKVLITTEIWDESQPQPWNFGEKNMPPRKFKLVMKWEFGKNYAITKVLDEKDQVIYFYCDICSSVNSDEGIFEFQDWYLDIIKRPNQKPILDDEDEFEATLKLGYLTEKEGKLARKTANQVINMLFTKNPDF